MENSLNQLPVWCQCLISILGSITLYGFLGFFCIFMVLAVVYDVRKGRAKKRYLAALPQEEREIIEKYNDVDVPIFPQRKKKDAD